MSEFIVIAGPCAVENEGQIGRIAQAVAKAGASMLRGGAFKPRTSPYSFQGLGEEGFKLLEEAGKNVGLSVVSEVTSPDQLKMFSGMIQIGSRNMQNYELLKAVGDTRLPVLLKRGMCSTIDEWLMSAEYILSRGNKNVMLCERGIRTFETHTRNTLDLGAVAVAKTLTSLPVIVDPSHAAGRAELVEPLALAALAVGADGVMLEVHDDPEKALCDGEQALTPDAFKKLMNRMRELGSVLGKVVGR